MSVVSLAWMMDEVEQPWTLPDGTKRPALRFSPGDRQLYHERQNVYDKLYDSRAGVSCVYRYMPRDIVRLCQKSHVPPRLHVSAVERCMAAPAGYAPGNIPREAQVEGVSVPEVAETMQMMRKELAEYPSMLDHVQGLIILRRVTYDVVLEIAALVTIMAWAHAQWKWSERSAWGLLRAIGEFILYAVTGARWWVATLLLAMLAAYGINWLAARKMHNVFSTFWYCVRSDVGSAPLQLPLNPLVRYWRMVVLFAVGTLSIAYLVRGPAHETLGSISSYVSGLLEHLGILVRRISSRGLIFTGAILCVIGGLAFGTRQILELIAAWRIVKRIRNLERR
jgi:hypothetical protein